MELNRHFLLLIFISLLSTVAEARVITLVNKCDTSIWPAFDVIMARQRSEVLADGLELGPGQSANLTTPPFWSLFIWGRSGCSFDSSGNGTCITGDCGGMLRCPSRSLPKPPVTMVTVTLNDVLDAYGVLLGAGFNIPVSISPIGPGSDNCNASSCSSDINGVCPGELQVRVNGRVVACKSACLAFNKPEYCCSQANGKNKCKPTNYTKVFKQACPTATADGSDTNLFTCKSTDYLVTFC